MKKFIAYLIAILSGLISLLVLPGLLIRPPASMDSQAEIIGFWVGKLLGVGVCLGAFGLSVLWIRKLGRPRDATEVSN